MAFDEGSGEEGEELAEQEGFDAVGGLEVDGGDGLVVFEDVVSAFEVGLVAVRGEDFGVGEGGVVGDERETAVGGGVVGNGGSLTVNLIWWWVATILR
ncbi:MAG: hypothetical protein IPG03_04975 [Candidatus Microthrix sp.]|nr:hypothetical protein [Candidatus Microthrix sp.]MBK6501723.1 hypothetical protein [Candidatus Microthrix sp.]